MRLASIGLSGSGKTTLIAMLPTAFAGSGLELTPDEGTSRRIRNLRESLILRGAFPQDTPVGSDPIVYRFQVAQQRASLLGSSRRMAEFEVADPAGDDTDPYKSKINFYQTFTLDAFGFLVLLDSRPNSEHRGQHQLFLEDVLLGELSRQAEARRGGGSKAPLPKVAVCLTMADQRPEVLSDPVHGWEQLAKGEIVRELIGSAGLTILNEFHRRGIADLRLFALSAIGLVRDSNGQLIQVNGRAVSQEKDRKLVDRGNLRPENVLPPFRWLLSG